ncbi:MAG TPA: DinB family protein [Anaerolineae bacterium]|nr:DinB family protein [Anaerolineae bacterium]
MTNEERSQTIQEYGRGFDLLTDALAQIPRPAWEFKPASDQWSVHETIIHMADSEMVGVLRLHTLIAEPGNTVIAYNESKWAEALGYRNQNTDDALQLFQLLRRTTYHLLQALPAQVFTHSVTHSEWNEPYTLEKWLVIYANHVPEHIAQMKKTVEAWK